MIRMGRGNIPLQNYKCSFYEKRGGENSLLEIKLNYGKAT